MKDVRRREGKRPLQLTALHSISSVHDHDHVGLDDGVEAVGDCDECAAAEFLADGLLDEGVCLDVNVGRCLRDHQGRAIQTRTPRSQ